MAWMKASSRGCTPIFGGISTAPSSFARKTSSRIPTTSTPVSPTASMSARLRYRKLVCWSWPWPLRSLWCLSPPVGKPTGRSGLVARNTVSGSHSSGKATVYTQRGTLVATLDNDIQARPDGSVRFPGTFKVVKGTGRFKGATGSGTFEGVLPANGSVYEFTLKGKVRY